HAGEISDHEENVMPEVLQLAQLVDEHRVPEMEVRGGGIEPGLYPQRSSRREPSAQLGFDQQLVRAAPDDLELLFDGNHDSGGMPGERVLFHDAKYGWPKRAILLSWPHPKNIREIMQQGNGVIVAAPRRFVGRESGKILVQLIAGSRLFRAAAALVMPFAGVVAAFGIAPDTVTEALKQTPVVLELALPASSSGGASVEGYWREGGIQRGDTLAALLARLGAADPEALQHLRSTRSARALYQLVPGRMIGAQITAEGRLLEVRYRNGGNVLNVERRG